MAYPLLSIENASTTTDEIYISEYDARLITGDRYPTAEVLLHRQRSQQGRRTSLPIRMSATMSVTILLPPLTDKISTDEHLKRSQILKSCCEFFNVHGIKVLGQYSDKRLSDHPSNIYGYQIKYCIDITKSQKFIKKLNKILRPMGVYAQPKLSRRMCWRTVDAEKDRNDSWMLSKYTK